MIATECQKCGLRCRILGKPEEFRILEAPQWGHGYPCVRPSCNGLAVKISPLRARGGHEVPIGAYFRALHGLGFGLTAPADPEVVRNLFETRKVLTVNVSPIGEPTRTIIHELTFDDGTVLHFASSNEGACIFLVEEATDANDRLAADRDPEDASQGRAQDGRAPAASETEGRTSVRSAHEQSNSGSSDGPASEVLAGSAHGPRVGGHSP